VAFGDELVGAGQLGLQLGQEGGVGGELVAGQTGFSELGQAGALGDPSSWPHICWWGRGSEVDREAIACGDLGKFVVDTGKADLESLDFAQPSVKFGLVNAVLHAPDFLVRSAGGAVMVLDSRPARMIGERNREAFAATGRACAALSWRYAVWDRLDGVFVADQRWLVGYRHPRCFDEHVAARLLEVFNRPRALMEGAELVGDPLGVLPVLYHLLWKQLLVADLAVVLSPRTIVRTVHHHADLAEVAAGEAISRRPSSSLSGTTITTTGIDATKGNRVTAPAQHVAQSCARQT
jgi:hypothetical protein